MRSPHILNEQWVTGRSGRQVNGLEGTLRITYEVRPLLAHLLVRLGRLPGYAVGRLVVDW